MTHLSRRLGLRRVLAICLPLAGIGLAASTALADAPKVVVTIKPAHALVAEIMRGVAEPELLVKGQASPHTFALKPSDTRALHAADVLVRVADTVEPFTTKVLAALPASVGVVTLLEAPALHRLARRRDASFAAHDHGHDDNHAHDKHADDQPDGHAWLDPANARAMARHIESALGQRFPGHAPAFQRNREALEAKLASLDAELAALVAPLGDKPYVVFHDAFQYFEHRYKLKPVGAIFVSPDIPPSGRRLRTLRRQVAALQAQCVFGEPYSDPRLLQTIVEGSNMRIGVLDAEGLALEPGPDLYFRLMRGLARSLRACLAPGV